VAGLVDPPQRLLRPALVRRVLRRTGGARPATATGRRTDPVTSSTADWSRRPRLPDRPL